MPVATQLVGFILLMIGAGAFLASGLEFTALIPAFFGVLLLGAGALAQKDAARRKQAMHAAALIALVAVLATAPTALGAGAMGDASDMAQIEAVLTAVLCLAYLAASVRSFVAARKARG